MPKLVCSKSLESEQVTYYTIEGFSGGEFTEVPASSNPEYGFEYDVSSLSPGKYTVKAHACNPWQCSIASAPLDFTVPETPLQPTGLNISFI